MKIIKPKVKAQKKSRKKLPPDDYTPMMESLELIVDENRKFVFNVQRGGDEGLPCVDFRTYSTTEAYTGFTRKGVNFPLDLLPDVIRMLEEVSENAEKEGLYEEFEE